jgi:hypothetical protein
MLTAEQDQVDALASGALFSPCRRWRYLLWRRWEEGLPTMALIGLNPSTADELKDDPTIRRCIGFARDRGFGSLHMVNLFAWRSTSPLMMRAQGNAAIGPRNNEYITQVTKRAEKTICAWGVHGTFLGRHLEMRKHLASVGVVPEVLRLTRDGYPCHPLYLPKNLTPVAWPYFGEH